MFFFEIRKKNKALFEIFPFSIVVVELFKPTHINGEKGTMTMMIWHAPNFLSLFPRMQTDDTEIHGLAVNKVPKNSYWLNELLIRLFRKK